MLLAKLNQNDSRRQYLWIPTQALRLIYWTTCAKLFNLFAADSLSLRWRHIKPYLPVASVAALVDLYLRGAFEMRRSVTLQRSVALLRHESPRRGIGPALALQRLLANPSSRPIMGTGDSDSLSVRARSLTTCCELPCSSARSQPQVSTFSHLGWRWCARATQGNCVLLSRTETSLANPGAISSHLMVLTWTWLVLYEDRVTPWCQVTGEAPVSFSRVWIHPLPFSSRSKSVSAWMLGAEQEARRHGPTALMSLPLLSASWLESTLVFFLLPKAWVLKIDQISVDL